MDNPLIIFNPGKAVRLTIFYKLGMITRKCPSFHYMLGQLTKTARRVNSQTKCQPRTVASSPETIQKQHHRNQLSYNIGSPQSGGITQKSPIDHGQTSVFFSTPPSLKLQSSCDHAAYDLDYSRTKNIHHEKRARDIHKETSFQTHARTQRQTSGSMIGSVYDPCTGESMQYICDQCDGEKRSFTRPTDLQRHFRSNHAQAKPEYWCPFPGCHRSDSRNNPFPRKDKMRDHVRKRHPQYTGFGQDSLRGEEDDAEGYW
jgi:hypothetical protein